MYESPYRSPFLLHDDGPNAPLEHQRTISRLTVELGVLFYHKQVIPLEPLPETPLSEGPGHSVPDVLLFDNQAEKTRIVIEVSNSRGFDADLRKVIRLIEEDDYGILEGFVYNYKTRVWLRYRKSDGGVATESSYSELMNVDMGGMV